MSGVIDSKGVQWEHCGVCWGWVRLGNLGYQKPNEQWPFGRDICVHCVDKGIKDRSLQFEEIEPAPMWQEVEVEG